MERTDRQSRDLLQAQARQITKLREQFDELQLQSGQDRTSAQARPRSSHAIPQNHDGRDGDQRYVSTRGRRYLYMKTGGKWWRTTELTDRSAADRDLVERADIENGAVSDEKIADVAVGKVTGIHSHSNQAELDLVTDGDHDVRTDDPHSTLDGIEYSKSIDIQSVTSSEDCTVFFTNRAITITEIRAVIGATFSSVTWTARHDTNRSAAGTEVVTGGTVTNDSTTGSDVTSFDDATVPADSFVWIETTATSGSPGFLSVTVFFTYD